MKSSLILALFGAIGTVAQATVLDVEFINSSAFTQLSQFPDEAEVGLFQITFSFTAVDQGIYLNGALNGIVFRRNGELVDQPGTKVLASMTTEPNDSGPLWYYIPEGTSRRFRVMAALTPRETGFYSCEIDRLHWSTVPGLPGNDTELGPEFGTTSIFLRAIPEPATLGLLTFGALPLLRRCRR